MADPILVTGAHRSGTTWVGRMLCAGGEAFYIHEPFNNVRPGGPVWVPKPFPCWFYSMTERDGEYERLLQNVVAMKYPLLPALAGMRRPADLARAGRDWVSAGIARRRHKRPLLKDPIALFSAEWLARKFGMRVVVLIRHPAAFAASLKRLDWWFKFSNWTEQEELMRGRLAAFAGAIREYASGRKDIVDQSILMWNCMYSVVDGYRAAHPEWAFVRHEDLAADPPASFSALYRHCGLAWNSRAKSEIRKYSQTADAAPLSAGRPTDIRRESRKTVSAWKRLLQPEEVDRIRKGTDAVARKFYGAEDW